MRKPFAHSRHLNIGEIIASREAGIVRTILGSCVAICMHHHKYKASAICHAIYSGDGPQGDTRYMGECVRTMVKYFLNEGIPSAGIQVKIFGGAAVLKSRKGEISMFKNHNVESAIRALEDHGYTVESADTGGHYSRELYYDFSNGEAYVRKF